MRGRWDQKIFALTNKTFKGRSAYLSHLPWIHRLTAMGAVVETAGDVGGDAPRSLFRTTILHHLPSVATSPRMKTAASFSLTSQSTQVTKHRR